MQATTEFSIDVRSLEIVDNPTANTTKQDIEKNTTKQDIEENTIKDNPQINKIIQKNANYRRSLLICLALLVTYYSVHAYLTIIRTEHKNLSWKKIVKDNPVSKHMEVAKKTMGKAVEHSKAIIKHINGDKKLHESVNKVMADHHRKHLKEVVKKRRQELRKETDKTYKNQLISNKKK